MGRNIPEDLRLIQRYGKKRLENVITSAIRSLGFHVMRHVTGDFDAPYMSRCSGKVQLLTASTFISIFPVSTGLVYRV